MNFFNEQILNLSNYYLNSYALFPFAVCCILIFLTFSILNKENYSYASRMFCFISTSLIIWSFAYCALFCSKNEAVATWWARVQNIGVSFIPSGTFFFSLSLTNKANYFKGYSAAFLIFSTISSFIAFKTNFFVNGVYKYFFGYYAKYSYSFSLIFLLFFGIIMACLFILFLYEYRDAYSEKHKNRVKLFLFALFVANTASIDYLPAYGIKIYPLGIIPVLIFGLIIYYIIKLYNLTDITPAYAAKQIIDTMNDILFLCNKNGIIHFANPAAMTFFNKEEKEMIGKDPTDIIKDSDFTKNFYKLIKGGYIKDYEVKYIRGTNERILSLSLLSIKNRLQQTLAIVCIGRDRTEYKKAEIELKKTYAVTKTILEGVPVGVILLGKDKKVRQINETALKLLGLKTEKDIIHKTYISKIISSGKDSNQHSNTTEEIFTNSEGKEIFVLKTTLPIQIDNENFQLEAFIDITDRKNMEKELQEYKSYLEEVVKDRTKQFEEANKLLMEEITERKNNETSLRNYIDDLEKFQRITIDRKNKMNELKAEANELAKALGKPEPYNIPVEPN